METLHEHEPIRAGKVGLVCRPFRDQETDSRYRIAMAIYQHISLSVKETISNITCWLRGGSNTKRLRAPPQTSCVLPLRSRSDLYWTLVGTVYVTEAANVGGETVNQDITLELYSNQGNISRGSLRI